MIKLTLYNDTDVVVNAELIESVERTPDTLISLVTGKKLMVKESVEDVISKVLFYRRLINKSGRVFGGRGRLALKVAAKGLERWT